MGKILLISFEDNEREILNTVLSVLKTEKECLQISENEYQQELSYKGIKINLCSRKVELGNKSVELTYTEFEILHLLARSPGRIFSKEQIYYMVWNESCIGDCNIVMSHIQNLRKKIEDEPSKPLYIQTVWGVGYRFNPNMSSDHS